MSRAVGTVLDCFSRKVVGWSIADHMRTDLVADALAMAARTRGGLDCAVFHSDDGAQYGARAFAGLCDQLGVTRSMGARRLERGQRGLRELPRVLREPLQGAHGYGDAATCRRTTFGWLTRYDTRRRHSSTPLSSRSPRDQ